MRLTARIVRASASSERRSTRATWSGPGRTRAPCRLRRPSRAAAAPGRRRRGARRRRSATPAEVPAQRLRLDRDGEQARQRQAPVDHRQPDDGERDDERGARHPRQRLAHGLGDLGDVVADTRDEVAAAGALDALQRQRQDALDDALAQVGQRALAEPRDERLAERGQHALHDSGAEQQQRGAGELRVGALVVDEVDDVTEDRGHGEPRRGPDEQREPGGERQATPRAHERERGPAGVRGRCDRQRLVAPAHRSTVAR